MTRPSRRGSSWRRADSTALAAVCPSPQIEASRIAWPISPSSASSSPTEPSGVRRASRCERLFLAHACRRGTARTGRTTRRGRSGDAQQRCRSRSTVSSKTMTTPEPSVAPAARVALERERQCRARRARRTRRPRRRAAPPAACRPPRTPPASSISSRSVVPNGDFVDARAARRGRRGRRASCPVDSAVPIARVTPRRPPSTIERHVHQRLDVVDHGRLAEQARLRRERRLVARLAAVALDRVEQRRLFAADVGAGAAAELDVEARSPRPSCRRRANRARGPASIACCSRSRGQRVLAAHVDVALLAPVAYAGDRHRLDERERVVLHQHAVLERARLRLVGVADEVVRPDRVARHRLPLRARSGTPRRRGRAAWRPSLRAMTPCGPELDGPPQRVVAAVRAVVVEARGIDLPDAAQQPERAVAAGLRERAGVAALAAGRARRAPPAPARRSTGASSARPASSPALLDQRGRAAIARARGRGCAARLTPASRRRRCPRARSGARVCSQIRSAPFTWQAMSSQTCTTAARRGARARTARRRSRRRTLRPAATSSRAQM